MTETKIPQYWRSLDQLENSPEFLEFMHREFPVAASEFPNGISRRRWMQLMGASFALASVAGCRWETEKIAPLVHRPEGYIPGKPTQFATSIDLAGAPRHLLVTCYDGRPIKVEGNPEHPASLGATDVFSQATTLTLYDPDRSHTPRQRLKKEVFQKSWADFEKYAAELIANLRGKSGAGLAVLLEPSSSLSQAAMVGQLAESLPQAKFYEYAPLAPVNELAGTEMAFGQPVRTHYKLADTKVIASFDADLLSEHPNRTRYARDYAATRELDDQKPADATMGRLYAVESQFSLTGASADHRVPMKSSDIGAALLQVRDMVQQRLDGTTPEKPLGLAEREKEHQAKPATKEEILWCLAEDLVANQGESVVVVGERQPAEVHALAHQLNSLLGNFGKAITFTTLPATPVEYGTIQELAASIDAGQVTALVIVGGNPAYDAPAELKFAEKIDKVLDTIRLGYYDDETSLVCQWHLPQCHPFEAWGDATSYEGLVSLAQPLINPLTDSKSPLEVLALLAGEKNFDPPAFVREAVTAAIGGTLDDDTWAQTLHDGLLPDGASLLSEVTPTLVAGFDPKPAAMTDGLEVVFRPSSSTYDGRFANNGWLQETPDFITKVTWDNVAVVSPHTASKKLRVKQGELLKVTIGEGTVEVPVYILPGQANDSIGIALGYGRTAAGAVGGNSIEQFRLWENRNAVLPPVGVNIYPLRTSENLHVVAAKAVPTGKKYPLAVTQDHFAIDTVGLQLTAGRIGELVREGTLDEYRQSPDFAEHRVHQIHSESLFNERLHRDRPNAWGMAIDLNKCIGCNGCMVACQAENNVPVVGKEQVLAGREMHWIRIDRYFSGMPEDFDNEEPASPRVATQMVACQQCETAPCEQVCPVAATVHTDEGLNDMVYNRCIGTRYCANNCPYKVRRFNYFHFTGYIEKPENQLVQLAMNPEVTVRSRGVMEKCTFCVQRIAAARIEATVEKRPIADGDVKTACQQACATQAITFGDLNDETSRVSQAHASPRAYGMLAELNTRPRNQYLAKVRNPYPLLAPPVVAHHGGEHHHGKPDEGHSHGDHHHSEHDHEHGDNDHQARLLHGKRQVNQLS